MRSSRPGAVAAGDAKTVAAAESVLHAGGNAFDAVLAAMTTACIAEPLLTSLGGGGFLLAAPVDAPARVFDFFAQTPKRRLGEEEIDFYPITADFGTATQEFHIGLGAVATPGTIRGLFEVHRALGRMPMREIVAPALELARQGYPLGEFGAYVFRILAPILCASSASRALFCTGGPAADELCQEGDTLRFPETADALEALAHEDDELFYRGEMGRPLVGDSASGGGMLRADDLADYRVELREPLAFDYRGARILTNPPPSSGGLLVCFALALLADEAPGAMEFGGGDYLERMSAVIAATNRARGELDAAAPEAAHKLLERDTLARHLADLKGRAERRGGTTHISVIDGAGNLAALSASNGEGSGYVLPGTGIMVNNMLGEEDLNPEGFHRWRPDSRIASMMAPTLVRQPDGGLIGMGSGGSNRLRTAILQVLVNLLDFDTSLETAVQRPRLHVEGELISLEAFFDEDAMAALGARVARTESWPERNLFFGGVHAVARGRDGALAAVGDPRRAGAASVL